MAKVGAENRKSQLNKVFPDNFDNFPSVIHFGKVSNKQFGKII